MTKLSLPMSCVFLLVYLAFYFDRIDEERKMLGMRCRKHSSILFCNKDIRNRLDLKKRGHISMIVVRGKIVIPPSCDIVSEKDEIPSVEG